MPLMEMTLWDPFTTWQFGVASVMVIAVMTTIKRAIRAGKPELLNRGGVKAVLTAGNVVLGFVIAVPTGFLVGETYTQRVFTGICAGFLSHFVYHSFLKRFDTFGSDAPTKKSGRERASEEMPTQGE